MWIVVVGIAASTLAVLCNTPQVVHVWRSRSVEGLSARAQLFALSCNGFYLANWLLVGNVVQIITTIIISLQLLGVWLALVQQRRIAVTTIAEPIVLTIAALALGSFTTSAWVLGIACVLSFSSQIVAVRKVFASKDVSGVSIGASVTGITTTAVWIVYAILLGDTILIGSLSLALMLSVAMLARITAVQRAIDLDKIHEAAAAVEIGTVVALNERRLQKLENLHGVERRTFA
jgi:uncharacterized protein with PQ loop repeat